MHTDKPAAGFTFLVVDESAFQRRLIAETLRASGARRVEYAGTVSEVEAALAFSPPDALLADWDLAGESVLELVRRLRRGELGAALKRLPVLMVADRNMSGDIERARNDGVDEFLLRPFSTSALMARITAVLKQKREFVESGAYVGPCRRRRTDDAYHGPRRRLFDQSESADSPDTQIRKGLARMYAERIGALLGEAAPGKASAMRDLSLACAQLHQLAQDLDERLLLTATQSLLNYVRGLGAVGEINRDVVQAHLDAIVQLAELPNSQVQIRETVTRELGVMVSKKLAKTAGR